MREKQDQISCRYDRTTGRLPEFDRRFRVFRKDAVVVLDAMFGFLSLILSAERLAALMGPLPVEAQGHPSEEPLRTEAAPFPDQSPCWDRHSEAEWPIWDWVLFQEPFGSPDRCCSEAVSEPGSSEASVRRVDRVRVASVSAVWYQPLRLDSICT